MRAILGITEYFLDNGRNKIRSRAVVFPSSEPREISQAKKEEFLGRRASLGLQFCRSLFVCPRSTVTQKKDKRQLAVSHKIKIFPLIFF